MRFLMMVLLLGGTYVAVKTWNSSESRNLRSQISDAVRGVESEDFGHAKHSVSNYFRNQQNRNQNNDLGRPVPAEGIFNPESQGLKGGLINRPNNSRRRIFRRRPLLRNGPNR